MLLSIGMDSLFERSVFMEEFDILVVNEDSHPLAFYIDGPSKKR